MTEQEWLTSKDPIAMLDWLYQHHVPSDRKLRLAVCAMTRAVGDHTTGLLRRVNLAEMWADGEIDRGAIIADEPGESISWRDWVVAHHIPRDAAEWASQSYRWVAPFMLREVFGNPFQTVTLPLGGPCRACATEPEWQDTWCSACHKPRREPSPVLTPLVLQLAEAAYTVRTGTGTLDCELLAVLSDALEDAGLPTDGPCVQCGGKKTVQLADTAGILRDWICMACLSPGVRVVGRYATGRQPHPILVHLRDPGPHYRGCWAVDLLLGKE